ncbi:hypothetical protein CI610_01579 [invertebrate metagenome]|uniref:GtrA/DPMS transmembrane domain-containing protein n=1 Tax=invertebrate metagenome TaxID=1711999 RepID=A0A2H9T8G4_9ZZZZ
MPRIIKFLIVGATAACVHLCVLAFFVNIVELSSYLGNAIAFMVAFFVSYQGQSRWTFNDQSHGTFASAFRFLVVQLLCSFVLNQGGYAILLTFHIHYLLASFIVLATVPVVTYLLSKYWAFKP